METSTTVGYGASSDSEAVRAFGWTAAGLWASSALLFMVSPSEYLAWIALPTPAALCSIAWISARYFSHLPR